VTKKQPNPIDSIFFYNPNQVSFSCTNSQVNLVDKVNGNNDNHGCFIRNSNGLFLTESWVPLPTEGYISKQTYTDLYKYYKTDLYFRNTFSDTARSSYNSGPNASDSFIHFKTISSAKYDGYGTLKILNQTFDTVIKVRRTNFIVDSSYIPSGGGSYDKTYYNDEQFLWYTPSVHWPILWIQVSHQLRNNNGTFDTLTSTYYVTIASKSSTTGTGYLVKPTEARFNIYTSNEKIYLSSTASKTESVNYSLLDISGKVMKTGVVIIVPGERSSIPISEFSQGVYILKINTKAGYEQSLKILISK
jgi:hypothetical protein